MLLVLLNIKFVLIMCSHDAKLFYNIWRHRYPVRKELEFCRMKDDMNVTDVHVITRM